MPVPVGGAVLCGGSSRRMGRDKATVPVGGVAMARRIADVLLAAGCSSVATVGGDPVALAVLGVEHLADDHPGEGPLGGILTALRLGSPVVVVACDLPRLTAATVTRLIAGLGDHDVAMADTGRLEPLCAIWTAPATPVLRTRFEAGERAVHRAIEGLDVTLIAAAADDLRNVNTPDDLRDL